jgi:GNAT superfamily N-acetyltransferase
MSQLHVYASPDLPPAIKCQILSFIRIEWSWIFQGANQFWDYTQKGTHPVNLVITEHEWLISHAEVNWRILDQAGQSYKVYGVSAVFTFPGFRRQGYGRQIVKAATDYILASDADLAILFCSPELRPFYSHNGWTAIPGTQVLYGDPEKPMVEEEDHILILFVSGKGQQARAAFGGPVYVGRHTW